MKRSNKGFTLLEIIIVIIIIGILASVALPKLFQNIEFSHSAEALSALGTIQRDVSSCSVMSGTVNWGNCTSWATIGMTDPASANWGYALDSTLAAANGTYVITACYQTTSANCTAVVADRITMTINIDANGEIASVTKAGAGKFAKVR